MFACFLIILCKFLVDNLNNLMSNVKRELEDYQFIANPDPKKAGENILLRVVGTDEEVYYSKDGVVNKEWQLYYQAQKDGTFDANKNHRFYICLHKDELTGFVCNHTVRSGRKMKHHHNIRSSISTYSSPTSIYRKRSRLFLFPDLRYYIINNIVCNRRSYRSACTNGFTQMIQCAIMLDKMDPRDPRIIFEGFSEKFVSKMIIKEAELLLNDVC
jgi:hypothetical protein